jgi:hypothetical protein
VVSTGIIFCIYIHIFCTIFTLLPPFPATSPIPLVPTSQEGPVLLSCCLILWKKKMIFLLVWDKGSYTGSFLVIVHVYIIITPMGSSPLFFLLSTLLPFLWWFQNSIFILI